MALTTRDFDHVVNKLQMKTRPGKHLFVWLELEGKQVIWTARSHGRGELGNVERAIRRQLRVSERQMTELVDCSMTRDAYLQLLNEKGVI